MAINNRRNTYESFLIYGQVQFIGDKLIYVYVYQFHGTYTIMSLWPWLYEH